MTLYHHTALQKQYIDYTTCDQVQDFIEGKIQNLLIYGSCGTGKSHTLKYIAQQKAAEYTTVTEFIRRMNICLYEGHGSTEEFFWHNRQSRTMLLDDLGAESATENNQMLLYKFVEERAEARSVIATNLDLKKLEERYDERILSRIMGNYVVLKFEGEDWRLKNMRVEKPRFSRR